MCRYLTLLVYDTKKNYNFVNILLLGLLLCCGICHNVRQCVLTLFICCYGPTAFCDILQSLTNCVLIQIAWDVFQEYLT